MSETTPATTATPVAPEERAPWWLRLLQSLATAGLALALAILALIFAGGTLPALTAALEQAFSFEDRLPAALRWALGFCALAIVLVPLALLAVASRRKWITGRFLAAAWALVGAVLFWLAWDDLPIRHPLPVDEVSPVFPGAERSYAVLMKYSKRSADPEAAAFEKLPVRTTFGLMVGEKEKWFEIVTRHRETLLSDWELYAPQRRWLEELNAFDRIGDLTPSDFAADLPTFKVWRTLSQRACAHATLLALDGKRDEAIATLVPILATSRKLQIYSRTLVRSMLANTVEKSCLTTAGYILELGPVSTATRAQLRAALGPESAAAMARRLVLIEYAVFSPILTRMQLGNQLGGLGGLGWVLRIPLNLLHQLLINPNATANLYGEHVFELAELAETRDLGKLAVRQKGFNVSLLRKPGMKNLGGRLLLSMAVPSYERLVESHWKTSDLRVELRRRLE